LQPESMKEEDRPSRTGGHTRPRILEAPLVPREALDPDALKVIHRLRNFGYQAYLVGGCVRDLLLGRPPKDFDIATSARPKEVKKLFRNSRIIGRRFKLAHLFFGDKILEVSTFRKTPVDVENAEDGDVLIQQDNVFGTAEEDARRRDFTVNGLFYDPQRHAVLDWVDGLKDLKARRIRTIGDPLLRFREDPVRILRAVKFATRLGFEVDREGWEAMKKAAPDLARSAPPRILEEILRLLRSANALGAFQMLRQVGALKVILSTISDWLDRAPESSRDRFWKHLEALDTVVSSEQEDLSNGFLLAAVFLEPYESRRMAGEDPMAAIEGLLDPFAQWCRLSRKDRASVKRLCTAQRRFTEKKRRFRVRAFLAQSYFPEALKLLHLRCLALGSGWDVFHKWREKYAQEISEGVPEEPLPPPAPLVPGKEASHREEARAGAKEGEEPKEGKKKRTRKRRTRRTGTKEEKSPPAGEASRGDQAPSAGPAAEVKEKTEKAKGAKKSGRKTSSRGGAKEAPAKTGTPAGKGNAAKSRKKGRRSRVDPKETMCPAEGRCLIPTEEERDIQPAAKVRPEKDRPSLPEDEPSWGDW